MKASTFKELHKKANDNSANHMTFMNMLALSSIYTEFNPVIERILLMPDDSEISKADFNLLRKQYNRLKSLQGNSLAKSIVATYSPYLDAENEAASQLTTGSEAVSWEAAEDEEVSTEISQAISNKILSEEIDPKEQKLVPISKDLDTQIYKRRPIMQAVLANDNVALARLLKKATLEDINAQMPKSGHTALYAALIYGNFEAAHLLFDADPRQSNSSYYNGTLSHNTLVENIRRQLAKDVSDSLAESSYKTYLDDNYKSLKKKSESLSRYQDKALLQSKLSSSTTPSADKPTPTKGENKSLPPKATEPSINLRQVIDLPNKGPAEKTTHETQDQVVVVVVVDSDNSANQGPPPPAKILDDINNGSNLKKVAPTEDNVTTTKSENKSLPLKAQEPSKDLQQVIDQPKKAGSTEETTHETQDPVVVDSDNLANQGPPLPQAKRLLDDIKNNRFHLKAASTENNVTPTKNSGMLEAVQNRKTNLKTVVSTTVEQTPQTTSGMYGANFGAIQNGKTNLKNTKTAPTDNKATSTTSAISSTNPDQIRGSQLRKTDGQPKPSASADPKSSDKGEIKQVKNLIGQGHFKDARSIDQFNRSLISTLADIYKIPAKDLENTGEAGTVIVKFAARPEATKFKKEIETNTGIKVEMGIGRLILSNITADDLDILKQIKATASQVASSTQNEL